MKQILCHNLLINAKDKLLMTTVTVKTTHGIILFLMIINNPHCEFLVLNPPHKVFAFHLWWNHFFSWERRLERREGVSTDLVTVLEMPGAFVMIMRGRPVKECNSKTCVVAPVMTGYRQPCWMELQRAWLGHVTRWRYQALCVPFYLPGAFGPVRRRVQTLWCHREGRPYSCRRILTVH